MSNCLTLKKSNCKNCYKCIRHCPVKSIRFSGNQAHIIGNECILCGHCFVVCPQNAKQIVDDTEKVRVLLQSGAPVIVSLAPSFIANYTGVGIESMRTALKKLGFYVTDSCANFIFAKHETIPGGQIYLKLRQHGILVRHFDAPRIADFNRITVGDEEQMEALIKALAQITGRQI